MERASVTGVTERCGRGDVLHKVVREGGRSQICDFCRKIFAHVSAHSRSRSPGFRTLGTISPLRGLRLRACSLFSHTKPPCTIGCLIRTVFYARFREKDPRPVFDVRVQISGNFLYEPENYVRLPPTLLHSQNTVLRYFEHSERRGVVHMQLADMSKICCFRVNLRTQNSPATTLCV